MNKNKILNYLYTNETVRNDLYPDIKELLEIYINDPSFTYSPRSFESLASVLYSVYLDRRIEEVLGDV